MFIDKENLFCEGQEITATAPSTDYITVGENIGAGEPIRIEALVTETFTSANGTTLQVALESDSDPGFGTKVIEFETPAIAKTALVKGHELDLPSLVDFHGKHIRLNFTVTAGPFTAGKITAGLVKDKQTNKY